MTAKKKSNKSAKVGKKKVAGKKSRLVVAGKTPGKPPSAPQAKFGKRKEEIEKKSPKRKSAGSTVLDSSAKKKTTQVNTIVRPEREQKVVIPNFPITQVFPDENCFKLKVKTILVSQPRPENEKSPYLELAHKSNLKIDFRHFIRVEGMTTKEFRQQKINLTEHNAVILTSRNAIDHFFRICGEMRYNVPETTKYFCLNEATAYYLQKYIQYRKRKIFFGNGSISDLAEALRKNRGEHFLLPVSDVHREEKIIDVLDLLKLNYKKAIIYRTLSADLSDFNHKLDYDIVVFFTPAGIHSLFKNFPKFQQGELRIAAFGAATANAVRAHGLRLDIAAPNPKTPSMTMALEHYIREVNKR